MNALISKIRNFMIATVLLCASPALASGVNNITFGVNTLPGFGGVSLNNGLGVSNFVLKDRTGTTQSDFCVDSNGDLVVDGSGGSGNSIGGTCSGKYGVGTPLPLTSRSPYTLTYTSNSQNFSKTIFVVPLRSDVKSHYGFPTNADTTTSFQLNTVLSGTTLPVGATVSIRDGSGTSLPTPGLNPLDTGTYVITLPTQGTAWTAGNPAIPNNRVSVKCEHGYSGTNADGTPIEGGACSVGPISVKTWFYSIVTAKIDNGNPASFVGNQSSKLLTVTSFTSGSSLAVGSVITGSFTTETITSLGTGTGGVGTYNVSVSQTIGSGTSMLANNPGNTLTVTSFADYPSKSPGIQVNSALITKASIGTVVTGFGTGSGGTGTYTVNNTQAVASNTINVHGVGYGFGDYAIPLDFYNINFTASVASGNNSFLVQTPSTGTAIGWGIGVYQSNFAFDSTTVNPHQLRLNSMNGIQLVAPTIDHNRCSWLWVCISDYPLSLGATQAQPITQITWNVDFNQISDFVDLENYNYIIKYNFNYSPLPITSNPFDGDYVAVNGIQYTYRNSPTLPNDVFIGSSGEDTMFNLICSINGGQINGGAGLTMTNNAGGTITFTGSISGNTLTVTSYSNTQSLLQVGSVITGSFTTESITGYISGTGGVGTYTVSVSQNVSSTTMTSTSISTFTNCVSGVNYMSGVTAAGLGITASFETTTSPTAENPAMDLLNSSGGAVPLVTSSGTVGTWTVSGASASSVPNGSTAKLTYQGAHVDTYQIINANIDYNTGSSHFDYYGCLGFPCFPFSPTFGEVAYNVMARANGKTNKSGPQFFFWHTTPPHTASVNAPYVHNNVGFGPLGNSIVLAQTNNMDIERNTIVQDPYASSWVPGASEWPFVNPPVFSQGNLFGIMGFDNISVGTDCEGTGGLWKNNISNSYNATNWQYQGATQTALCLNGGPSIGGTTYAAVRNQPQDSSSVLSTTYGSYQSTYNLIYLGYTYRSNPAIITTAYQIAFSNFPNGQITTDTNRAALLKILTPAPKVTIANGGTAIYDAATGLYSYAGALFPACHGKTTGAWNDGTEFTGSESQCIPAY